MRLRATKTFDCGALRRVIRDGEVFDIEDRQGYQMLAVKIAEAAPQEAVAPPPAPEHRIIVPVQDGKRRFDLGPVEESSATAPPAPAKPRYRRTALDNL